MRVEAHILDTHTGARGIYAYDSMPKITADNTRYWWTEGNMACDRNRVLALKSWEDADGTPCNTCGEDQRYQLERLMWGDVDLIGGEDE